MSGLANENNLPNEVWENILAHLPITDLLKNKCLVSKQWNDIISRKGFMKWKKQYHCYRLDANINSDQNIMLKDECDKSEIKNSEECIPSLIKFMAVSFIETDKNNENGLEALKFHPKLNLVQDAFKDIYGNLSDERKSLWATVSVICTFSQKMEDIYLLFNLLATNSCSVFTSKEVLEKLYCIGTFLLYYERKFQIPSMLHYNVFSALHHYENCWNLKARVHQPVKLHVPLLYSPSSPVDRLTHEQKRIINHNIQHNDLIKVVAYAGAGKTSTIIELVKKRRKALVLYYNKSMAAEANKKFPSNAICKTFHALAISPMLRRYPFFKDEKRKTGSLHISHVRDAMTDRTGFQLFVKEVLVHETLCRFMGSAEREITHSHCPEKIQRTDRVLTLVQKEILVMEASRIWEMMISPQSPNEKKNPPAIKKGLPHDCYLKLFQLSNPNIFHLPHIGQVDLVVIDEGQDMSACMLAIFNSQNGPRIIIGDPAQQIYQWRYAINTLDGVTATHTYYLSQSFRFGPSIAFLANSLLKFCNTNHTQWLVGTDAKDELRSADRCPIDPPLRELCYISRSNLTLFQKVIQIIEPHFQKSVASPSKSVMSFKIAFAGGMENYDYDTLVELNFLRRGELDRITKNKYLKTYRGDYTSFVKKAELYGETEWLGKIAIVKWAGYRTEQYVNAITSCTVKDMKYANAIFSTTHKSKGLEWHTVALIDDFVPELVANQSGQEEANVLYVAATRAKRCLVINPACYYVLLSSGENFQKIIRTQENTDLKCPCGQLYPGICSARLVSVQRTNMCLMTLGNNYPIAVSAAVLCSSCAGFNKYSPPRFSCYNSINGLPCGLRQIETDHWRSAFRFLIGPKSEKEKQKVENLYKAREIRLRGGIVQANQLVGIGN